MRVVVMAALLPAAIPADLLLVERRRRSKRSRGANGPVVTVNATRILGAQAKAVGERASRRRWEAIDVG